MEWLLIDPSQQIPANRQWGKNTAPPTCWRPPECRHQTSPRASPSRLSWLCMQLCEHEYIVLVYIYIYYVYTWYIYIYTPYNIYIYTYAHASIYLHYITLHYIPFHSIPFHYITLHYIYIYIFCIYIHMHLYVYIYISIYIYYMCINIKGWKLWRHLLGRMIQVWS